MMQASLMAWLNPLAQYVFGASDFQGSLLLPCYDEVATPAECFTLRSRDGGRTWGEPTRLAADAVISFYEPCLLNVGNRLIALLRTHREGGRRLYQCESTDSGRSWSRPEPTVMTGYPAHAIQLADGRIFCVYGVRWERFGIRGRLSGDGGRTWGNEIVVRDDFPDGDLGYPTAAETSDGLVRVAYYGRDTGGVTCLFTNDLQLSAG